MRVSAFEERAPLPLPPSNPTHHPAGPPARRQCAQVLTYMLRSMTVMAGETTEEAITAAAVCPTKMLPRRPSPTPPPVVVASSSSWRWVMLLVRASDMRCAGVLVACVCCLVACVSLSVCVRGMPGLVGAGKAVCEKGAREARREKACPCRAVDWTP